MAERATFAALPTSPPAPNLVLGGHAMPQATPAKMQAIPSDRALDARWVQGSLGLHEKLADAIGQPVAAFLST